MKKEFKIRRVFRIIILVLSTPAAILLIYESVLYLLGAQSLLVNGPIYVFIPILIFILIFDWFQTKYTLNQNHLIVQQPFWKDKIFDLNDIKRIFEMKGPFPSIVIKLKSRRLPLYLNIDDSDTFISSILNITKESKTFTFDSNNKGINFKQNKHTQPGGCT